MSGSHTLMGIQLDPSHIWRFSNNDNKLEKTKQKPNPSEYLFREFIKILTSFDLWGHLRP